MFNLIVLSLMFGIFTKLADLVNEHAYKEPFRGFSLISGIVWGIIGALLITTNNSLQIFYISLIYYWILKNKLEYKNHAIGGLIVLITGYKQSIVLGIDFSLHIVILLLIYEGTYYLNVRVKGFWKSIVSLRLYLIPFFYSLYVYDFTVFIASCLAISGVRITKTAVSKFHLLEAEIR